MTTLDHVLSEHERLTKKAFDVVETKGRDYNRKQQKQGKGKQKVTTTDPELERKCQHDQQAHNAEPGESTLSYQVVIRRLQLAIGNDNR